MEFFIIEKSSCFIFSAFFAFGYCFAVFFIFFSSKINQNICWFFSHSLCQTAALIGKILFFHESIAFMQHESAFLYFHHHHILTKALSDSVMHVLHHMCFHYRNECSQYLWNVQQRAHQTVSLQRTVALNETCLNFKLNFNFSILGHWPN